MKRILYVLGFIILGIFSMFMSGSLVVKMEDAGLIPTVPTDACWETIEMCDPPWFITLEYYVYFLLPPAAYAITGWLTWKRSVNRLKAIVFLLMATFIFYFAAHVVEGVIRAA